MIHLDDAERWWAVGSGIVGLASWAGGSLLADLPGIDADDEQVVEVLARRRTAVLTGSVLAVAGTALLLWPLALVASIGEAWTSLQVFGLLTWVLGFATLGAAAVATSALVWRDPTAIAPATVRLVLDAAHLATWSISAPLGALSTATTTAVVLQAGGRGAWVPLLVLLAAAKVATVVVEVAGTARRTGWNAGGRAAGSSGYVTVAWFAPLLLVLACAT